MSVVECDVPGHGALGKDLIERIDFRDAYRAPLSRSDLSVVEISFAISRGVDEFVWTGAAIRHRRIGPTPGSSIAAIAQSRCARPSAGRLGSRVPSDAKIICSGC